MKTKNKKLLAIGTGVMAVALGVGVFASLGHAGLLLRSGADLNGSFTFVKTTARTRITSTKYSFASTNARGSTMYIVSAGQGMSSTSQLGSMRGNEDTNYMVFTLDPSDLTSNAFQSVISMTISTYSTTSTNKFKIYDSADGHVAYTNNVSDSGAQSYTITSEVAGAKYIKIVSGESLSWLDIASVTVNYSCNPSGEPEEDPVLESLTLSGGKNHFNVNDEFSFTGTATARYSNGSSKAVSPIVSTAPDMTSLGVKTAVLSYSEDDVTVYANFEIQVGVYGISYSEMDWSSYEPGELTHISLAQDAPTYAAPASNVNFNVIVDEGYALTDCYEANYRIDSFSISGSSVSFTMSNYYDINVVFVVEPVIIGISVDENAPTEQNKGTFVRPTIWANYGDGNKVNVTADAVFDANDYDINTVGDYVVDVTYGDFATTYSFSVVEPSGDLYDNSLLNGSYSSAYSASITCVFIFDGNGNGTYKRKYNGVINENYTINFEYQVLKEDGSTTIRITDSQIPSSYTFPNGYKLANHNDSTPGKDTYTNSTGFVSGNVFSIKLGDQTGGYHIVETPKEFAKDAA